MTEPLARPEDLTVDSDPGTRYDPAMGDISWNGSTGELTMTGLFMDEVLRVRVQLQEKILRLAVVSELERLGYTIISPDDSQPAPIEVQPHPFDRDRTAPRGEFRCKACPAPPHHAVHTRQEAP